MAIEAIEAIAQRASAGGGAERNGSFGMYGLRGGFGYGVIEMSPVQDPDSPHALVLLRGRMTSTPSAPAPFVSATRCGTR